jgi:hypothetical protein
MSNTEPAAATFPGDGTDRPSWLAVATGLNTAMLVTYLACKPPQVHTLSWRARLFTSAVYLLIACLAGAAGTWIALSIDTRRQFRQLVLWGARGWIFLPAIMMFLREKSVWAPLVAAFSAALMAAYLYRFTEANRQESHTPTPSQSLEKNLFTTQIRLAPTSWVPFYVSLLLYGAFLSAVAGELEFVTLFLAGSTFLLALEIITALTNKREPDESHKEDIDRSSHLSSLFAAAFFCVFIALTASPAPWRDPLRTWMRVRSNPAPAKQTSSPDHSSSGYRTIVLWPIQKKEKVIPSPPLNNTSTPGNARPWIIPFYGPYWYFKSVGESPGPNARTTHGDPLKVNVHSTDKGPLLMEAHQYLADPVDLTCCREMQVVFRNDTSLGAFAVSISLTDSHSKGKQSQNLGIKSVAPSPADPSPANISPTNKPPGNASSVEETLTFPFPKHGVIKKFDAITVVLLPDAQHRTAGRKVAVERFVMIPN